MENKLSWVGFEVQTREATWVCVKSSETATLTMDGIEFNMEFAARNPRVEGIPATRMLRLRTLTIFKANEPDLLGLLTGVVKGQLMETMPWDRFIEFNGPYQSHRPTESESPFSQSK